MIFCLWCDAEQIEDFPARCSECGAEFDHEGELVGEDWKPVVIMTKKGDPAKYWADPPAAAEPPKPDARADFERSFHHETEERADRERLDSMGGHW